MNISKIAHCNMVLELVESSIRKLELKEFNLELEGKFNSDRDQQLELTRAELNAEKERRKRVLEELDKLTKEEE